MAGSEFRLLGKALALGHFTAPELARAAAINVNTVSSWIRRNPQFVVQDGAKPSSFGPGRPQSVYRLRDDAVPQVRARLDQLFPEAGQYAERDLRANGYLYDVDRAEKCIATWRKACQSGRETERGQAEVEARSWIRIAWEDFAELNAAGVQIKWEHLKRLAELEREIGGGEQPASGPLAPLAKWLVQRLDAMSQRGITEEFAACTLRVRAQVRSKTSAAALTAAALAAPVWWDEGLSNDVAVGASAVDRCAVVVNLVSSDCIHEELMLMLNRDGPYEHPEQSQAVLLGLAKRSHANDKPIHHWLSFLLTSSDWQIALAPAILYGLGQAGHVNLRAVLNQIELFSARCLGHPLERRYVDAIVASRQGPQRGYELLSNCP